MMWPAEVKLGIHNGWCMNIADYSRLLELTKLFHYMQKYTPLHLKIINFSPILYSLACEFRSEQPHFTYVLRSHSLTSQHLQESYEVQHKAAEGDSETELITGVDRHEARPPPALTTRDGDQVGYVILTVWSTAELFADRYKQLLFLVMESN